MSVSELLARADVELAKINVKGDDVFAMTTARRLLKAAWDKIEDKNENTAGDPDI